MIKKQSSEKFCIYYIILAFIQLPVTKFPVVEIVTDYTSILYPLTYNILMGNKDIFIVIISTK